MRPAHDHPVPAAVRAAPPGRPVGAARGVRRTRRGSPRARLRRRDVGPAGPLLLPRRPPVSAGDILTGMVNKPPGAASKKAAAEPAPGRIKQIGMVAGLIRKT